MKVAYVVAEFPSLTETFIQREILALERRGIDGPIFALRRPLTPLRHPDVDALLARTHYPSPFRGLSALLRHPRRALAMTRRAALKQVVAASDFATVARRTAVVNVHAHFAFVTADVARLIASSICTPFTVSCHAWDIYAQGDEAVAPHLAGASAIAVCTEHGATRVRERWSADRPERVTLVRHGVTPSDYVPCDGTGTQVLAVGRLEEKKGFAVLLDACRLLVDRGVDFRCELVGEGPLGSALRARAAQLGLTDRVSFSGALARDAVLAAYRRSALLVHPSVTTAGGDRDGLPNVILEAMASGVPAIAGDASAAREAIDDGVHGFIVPSRNAEALADKMQLLLGNLPLRTEMGRRSRERVRDRFDIDCNIEPLIGLFREIREPRE